MVRRRPYERGDILVVDLEPTRGSEQRGRRHVLVLTPSDYNATIGRALVAPITQGGNFARYGGFAVSLTGTGLDTQGVVLLTDLRVMDLAARGAKRVETAPAFLIELILDRVKALLD
ncbi:MAG: type II toxin-antitoxin system ChpB family toxin [Xanthomonadales bacterium]|nr:type II toxin-antitoxin system ChpB family toxin [Xanthomonadales bacterium]